MFNKDEYKNMTNISDNLFLSTTLGFILGIPVFIGIIIIAIPLLIVSFITEIPIVTLMQNLLAFAVAVFFIWLFSKYQIIENGIVGLIIGSSVYAHFKWHPVACILIGVVTIGLLFLISYISIGFWIKTISFSLIVTFFVYAFIYSEWGLFPLPDMVWKITFFIIFLLENIFIRYSVAYDNA